MTELKHTPAPWKVTKGKKTDELYIEDVQSNGRVCRLWNGRTATDDNAHLIAAAPELLEVLEYFIDCFEIDDLSKRDKFIEIARQKAVDKIAKAKGIEV